MRAGDDPTFDDLSIVIAGIYRSALDGEFWPTTLDGIINLVGGLSATLWSVPSINVSGTKVFEKSAQLLAAVRPIQASSAAYLHYYSQLDPLAAALKQFPAGSVVSREMVFEPAAFRRSEFYNDFAKPNDLIDCALMHEGEGSGHWVLGVGRSHHAGPFEAADRRVLGLLALHLRQAIRVAGIAASGHARRGTLLEALSLQRRGAIVLGRRARVLFANAAAERLLREADGVGVEGGRFRLSDAHADRRLGTMLEKLRTAGGAMMLVVRAPGRLPIILDVTPVPVSEDLPTAEPAEAIVFLSAPELAIGEDVAAALQSGFGLTQAEAAATCAILAAPNMAAAAVTLGVAQSTLRWHLRSVFSKTGVTRQMELALLIAQLGMRSGRFTYL